jgi:hypothetical protein
MRDPIKIKAQSETWGYHGAKAEGRETGNTSGLKKIFSS